MLISRSFVDILFILLCATIVLLAQSIHVGAVDTAPAKLGAGGVSSIDADDVRVVVVGQAGLTLEDEPVTSAAALASRIEPNQAVLLVARDPAVTHQRVMDVWSRLAEAGLAVKLGAEPAPEDRE